jgi:hypothetical protein
MTDTERKIIRTAHIILDTITEAGAEGFPSGYLYAACMNVMPYDAYMQIISALKAAGKITENNNVLKAVSHD